jgi:hypothetical protein
MAKRYPPWAPEEDDLLRKDYPTKTWQIPELLIQRTRGSISARAAQIGATAHPDLGSGIQVGQRFGRLVTIRSKSTGRGRTWACVCDCNPDRIFWRPANSLNGGLESCGCLRKENGRRRATNNATRLGPLRLAKRLAWRIWKRYKEGAKKRGYKFKLTIEDVYQLIYKPCHFCDAPPSNIIAFQYTSVPTNGIDRRNNEPWYDRTNTLPCCWGCNDHKGTMTYDEFMAYRRRVARAELLALRNQAPDIVDAVLVIFDSAAGPHHSSGSMGSSAS